MSGLFLELHWWRSSIVAAYGFDMDGVPAWLLHMESASMALIHPRCSCIVYLHKCQRTCSESWSDTAKSCELLHDAQQATCNDGWSKWVFPPYEASAAGKGDKACGSLATQSRRAAFSRTNKHPSAFPNSPWASRRHSHVIGTRLTPHIQQLRLPARIAAANIPCAHLVRGALTWRSP